MKTLPPLLGLLCLTLAPPAPATPPVPTWTFHAGRAIAASATLGPDDTVYVAAYDGQVHALDPTNGTVRWTLSLTPTSQLESVTLFASPAVASDGTVYIATQHSYEYDSWATGELLALNPANGSNLWTVTFSNAIWATIYSDPAIGHDGTIYVGSYDTNLYAINPNGTEKWRFTAGDQIYSDVIVAPDQSLYFGCDNGMLYALNPDGSLRWTFQGGRGISGSPALGPDGTVYFGATWGTNGSRLYALNPDGSKKWDYYTGGYVESSPALGPDGTLYVGANNNGLFALNPDGSLKWLAPTQDKVRSSPALCADGTLYVGCDDNLLYAFDAQGSNLWTLNLSNTIYCSPTISPNGTLYIGSAHGRLHALPGTSNLALSTWPMFRKNPRHTATLFPPPTATVAWFPQTGTLLNLQTQPSERYVIATSPDLHQWQPWTNFTASSPSTTLIDSLALTDPIRFYRLHTR